MIELLSLIVHELRLKMVFPGNATRLCQSNLVWAKPNVTNCQSRVVVDIMERVRELESAVTG